MTSEQLKILQELEEEIFRCGIDGGMSTTEAIDALERKEKEFGVYDENATVPRWVNK